MLLFYAKIGCYHSHGVDQLQIRHGSSYLGIVVEAENIELALEKITNALRPFHPTNLEPFIHKSIFKTEGVRYSINFQEPEDSHYINDCAEIWDSGTIKVIS